MLKHNFDQNIVQILLHTKFTIKIIFKELFDAEMSIWKKVVTFVASKSVKINRRCCFRGKKFNMA